MSPRSFPRAIRRTPLRLGVEPAILFLEFLVLAAAYACFGFSRNLVYPIGLLLISHPHVRRLTEREPQLTAIAFRSFCYRSFYLASARPLGRRPAPRSL